MSEFILKARDLNKFYTQRSGRFGFGTKIVKALDNVNLDLRHAQTLAVVGEPGETIGTEIAEYTDPVTGEFETEQLINPVTGEIREVSTASEYRQLRSAGWIEE